jgi:hypothetical protein
MNTRGVAIPCFHPIRMCEATQPGAILRHLAKLATV